ncbi:MAG: diacylglycerol kinase family protein [Candidatus Aminicenantes bacterium]
MDKIAILFNPSSGRGLSLKKKDDIKAALEKNSISFQWFKSESEKHLKELAREKAESFPIILVVGGDTSFQIAASEIYQTPYNPALCMIPTGSANDIAISLGCRSLGSILESLKEMKTRMMDMGLLEIKGCPENIYFVGSLSLGLGVTINQFVAQYWKNHPLQAKLGNTFQVIAGFLGARYSFKKNKIPMKIQLASDNFKNEVDFSIIVFSNVPFYAGGFRVHPETSPFDGKINCSVINTKSLGHTTQLAYSVWKQKHRHKHKIQFFDGMNFTAYSKKPINVQYDGKVVSGVKEFKVSVLPSAIKILG